MAVFNFALLKRKHEHILLFFISVVKLSVVLILCA